MKVIIVHVDFLMIQIQEEFLRVLKLVIQFYARGDEFFPEKNKLENLY